MPISLSPLQGQENTKTEAQLELSPQPWCCSSSTTPRSTHPFSFPSGFHPVSPGTEVSVSPCLLCSHGEGGQSPPARPCQDSRMPGTLSMGICLTPSLKQVRPG